MQGDAMKVGTLYRLHTMSLLHHVGPLTFDCKSRGVAIEARCEMVRGTVGSFHAAHIGDPTRVVRFRLSKAAFEDSLMEEAR
jgi:hypothetical protein